MSPAVVGRPLPPAEQQRLTDLQGLFKPGDALKRVDDFAKWIFGSTAVVGTLGAGLSNVVFQTLGGAGKVFLAAAILLVGVSLYEATLALAPQWVQVNPASRDALLAAERANLQTRRRALQRAARFFAIALVVAGCAPFASVVSSVVSAWARPQHIVLNYEWKPEGRLWAQLTGVGLRAYAAVEVSLETTALAPLEQARVRKAADASGKAEATLEVVLALPPGTPLHLTGQWADASTPGAPLLHKQTLKISVPAAKPKSTIPAAPPPASPAKKSD